MGSGAFRWPSCQDRRRANDFAILCSRSALARSGEDVLGDDLDSESAVVDHLRILLTQIEIGILRFIVCLDARRS